MARFKSKSKKKKQTDGRHDVTGTGGGLPKAEPLDEVDKRIIDSIGVVPISGDPLYKGPSITFDFQQPSTSSHEIVHDSSDTPEILNIM